jgi:hypothetical protein
MRNWWSWRELNPRPQAFFEQFYMCSRLIGFSFTVLRSDTPHHEPASLNLVEYQETRHSTSPCEFPCSLDDFNLAVQATLAQPIGQLLQGSPD